jgi:hypothetical protein
MTTDLLLAVLMLAQTASPSPSPDPSASHHNMVMTHGAQVMPFDMKVAMHMFTPNATGGVVEVMVHNTDAHQIGLVRQHLQEEATKFAAGDYADPAYIHGEKMPGLVVMEANPKAITVQYADTRMGGKITFVSSNASTVQAIHQWLAAQTSDHGSMPMECDMKP